jgi:mRNA-degrading endonuclease toxin of MazEF toxin-antitoxin module
VNAVEGLYEELTLQGDAALLVDSLSPVEASRLRTRLEEARAAEAADVDTAVDAMVAAIPPPVRGRVRKVLQRDDR